MQSDKKSVVSNTSMINLDKKLVVSNPSRSHSDTNSLVSSSSVASNYLQALRESMGTTSSNSISKSNIISPTAQSYGMNRNRSPKRNQLAQEYAMNKVDSILRNVQNEQEATMKNRKGLDDSSFKNKLRGEIHRRNDSNQTFTPNQKAA